jgi:hypothetical protein
MSMQIVHSLRTNGDMNFDEITMVMPTLEASAVNGYGDLKQPQPGCLRAFKTHMWYPQLPKNERARYLFVVRDPMEVRNASFHHSFYI